MKNLPLYFSVIASAVLGTCAKAQVYIPNQALRLALNAQIPGLVDDSGMMDENDVGIAQIDSLWVSHGHTDTTFDLSGIEHLHSLTELIVWTYGDPLMIPEFPVSLEDLSIVADGQDEHVILGELPVSIQSLTIMFTQYGPPDVEYGTTGIVEIGGFSTFLPKLEVWNVPQLSWPDTAMVGSFALMSVLNHLNLTVPSMVCDFLTMPNLCSDLDLSHISARKIEVHEMDLIGEILWPTGVERLDYSNEYQLSLPSWPSGLDTLIVNFSLESCIPVIPNSVDHMILFDNIECIPNWPDELNTYSHGTLVYDATTAYYCSILNSDCPGTYPALAGVVRMDLNNNGLVDAGEPIVPSSSVSIAPGGQSTGCASDGSWQIGVPPGEHTITAASGYPYVVSMSPTSHAGSVPAMGDVDLHNDFAVAVQPDIQDVRVHVYADPARPGFANQVYLHCENYGTTPVDAELTLAFDADQTWLGSSVAPTSTSSTTATWNFPAMPIGAVQHIVVDLNTAASVALGTDITHSLTAGPTTTDETPLDNVYTFNDSVVGSYDPNDKLLSPAVLTPTEVALGETPIEYTIRFQNTGTYLAERVVILDTLSQDLQWESMRFIASSHDQHWYIVDGVLHVVYNDIMLPDSNTNEAASHGFFKFSMLPKTDLVNGSTIENIAHIVFDFNAPIITPPAVFTVDVAAGVAAASSREGINVSPNPAQDRIQVHTGGTGVLRYRIIDVLGAQVQTGAVMCSDWLAVEDLTPGTYMLVLDHGDAQTIRRFVKR